MEPVPLRPRRPTARPLAALFTVLFVVGACGSSSPEPSSSPAPTAVPAANASPSADGSSARPAVPSRAPSASAAVDTGPLASSGSIALVRSDGSLWLVDADGRQTLVAGAEAGTFGFPTWSPDGRSIASIRTGPGQASIDIFDAEHAAAGVPASPRTIFRSASIGPFYLSWTPDGQAVSFLANDGGTLALRVAPADASAPLDGSGPGAVIRKGSPLYFDWVDADHLLAHIGDGASAYLGEIGRDGAATGPPIAQPGGFRAVDVSADGRYVGYVRAGTNGADAIVAAARAGGTGERTMPVYGLGALDFAPADDRLAAIGATEAQANPVGLPVGPLRVMDAGTGAVTTLLEGPVVSFAWSPDGKTIAAIEVVPVAGASNVSTASPTTPPSPAPTSEVRLAFVDAASGHIRSQPVISPGRTYVNALMTYFDQYALSHRLWAPDSSSILLPQDDPDGTTHVDVVFPDGGAPISLDGEIGFWSP